MKWHEEVAKQITKHSDTYSVIRWGRKAKLATRRRNRRLAKKVLRS